MKYNKPFFAPFLMAAFLFFIPANGIAADSDLDLSDEEINELERLEDLVRGGGSTPAPTQDDTADKVSEEKARAEAARLADEKRKKAEVARLAVEKRKKAEAARLVEEKRKKAEAARKASEEAATKVADAADASSAVMLKVLDAKIRILKIKQDAMERKLKETGAKAEPGKIEISGFVDMSYFSDTNADTASFGMDQAEVDITHTVNDKASLRFDLEYGDTGVAVEQGYITVNAGSVTLTFGKFNAPIGFELLDAPDMYQFSHAAVFDNGLPTNLTGVMVSGGSGMFDISVYYVNGWDNNTDDNKEKTIGARLGVTPMEGINIGFSYISGNEVDGDDDPDTPGDQDLDQTLLGDNYNRSVIDIDFTYTRQENLTIGAEYNIGTEEKSSFVDTGDGEWTAYLVMVHYDFSDKFGLTARYDSFDDQDGSRLGTKEIRNAITVAPTFAIAEGLGGLIEWKTTTSNEKVFKDKDDKDVDSEQTLALELTFSF